MSRKMILLVILPLLLFAGTVWLLVNYYLNTRDDSGGVSAAGDGKTITIDSGRDHIEALPGPQRDYQFLLKDEGRAINTFAGDAFVTMLPLESADRLKARFGDFFHCDDPGAAEAIRSMQAYKLIAADAPTRSRLGEAMAYVRSSRVPVVRFSGSPLTVTRYTYLGMTVNDNAGIPMFYIKNLSIVRPDYMQ